MHRDKSRNARSFRRSRPKRPPFDRLLIVCEGTKTEPNYFNEIRQAFRISGAFVQVVPSDYGTQPMQIVNFALDKFRSKPDFERVYAVFDRDDHESYYNAIKRAEAHANKLRNRERQAVIFEAVASVPSFEVWFLMHYQAVTAWMHREQVLQRLCTFIPEYRKGSDGLYATTRDRLDQAKARAAAVREQSQRLPGDDIYTDVDRLVAVLHELKQDS